ncbi:MAG: undecaprenyl-diphosphatase [Thermotogota bacterium]|nr:undecaprenyl-diphosphatase [Thermotogota bacterium]MDK2864676.1 undecaprenyl-diphosphatase [Thermotogota bacterium]HCZ06184.1 UDP-diphosphatase [Thermotogota bacterium]
MVNDVIWSLFMGALQGATEFLPVSSSGHLLIFSSIQSIASADRLSFIAFLHLGTLVAVVFFVWNDVLSLFRSLKGLRSPVKSYSRIPEFRTLLYLITSTLVTGVLGLSLESPVEKIFSNLSWIVGFFYLILSTVLILSDRLEGKLRMDEMGFFRAILIGLLQSTAVLPGISRSGVTIFAGLLLGLQRTDALRYSFLLSIPITAAAGLLKFDKQTLNISSVTAFLASMLVGLIALVILKRITLMRRLSVFGYYCGALGIAVILGVNLL